MENKVELENLQDLPAKIFVNEINKSQCYWSNKIILIFVLRGSIKIKVNKKEYSLEASNIFLINQNVIYDLEMIELNKLCIIEIDTNYFNKYYVNFFKLKFNANLLKSYLANDIGHYDLWNILSKIVEANLKKEKHYLIVVKKCLYELILLLINKYLYSDKDKGPINENDNRLEGIVKFVIDHYKEKISLKDVSKHFHLNSQYISRYFSKQMGMTLSEFITKIRLQESLVDLCDEEKRITYIALEYGFPNSKSYFKAFKETYGITPLKYRKLQNKKVNKSDFSKNPEDEDWTSILETILNYTDKNSKQDYLSLETLRKYNIDFNNSKGYMKKSWRKVIAFGRAAEGLRSEWREQLKILQKEIPFEYIRFHGILSDDMMVYSESYNEESQYSFIYVEELIDFLLANNIKPFIELGFMPEQLAEEKLYKFLWKANISFPKDMGKWSKLVEYLIEHLIDRYGLEEVSTWYFEVWNNYSSKCGIEKSLEFIKTTFKAIKKINSKLIVGLNMFEQFRDNKLVEYFNSFCIKENIHFDFIGNITYSISHLDSNLSVQQLIEDIGRVSSNHFLPQNLIKLVCNYTDKDHISNLIDNFIESSKDSKIFENKVFITEFNLSPDPRDLLNDTCFKAPFLVKNILDNYNKVEGITYWVFSDIFDEISTSSKIFHGGVGLITKNGLKKPIYYAYQLLNKLGDIVIDKGEDFIATKREDGSLQIMAYNYCDFIEKNIPCSTKEITFYERYNVFRNESKEICFNLKGLKGKYIKKIYRVNRENGSVFDEYIKIGAPKCLNTEELKYLNRKAIYDYKIEYIDTHEDYQINEKLSPHEVLMIEIIP